MGMSVLGIAPDSEEGEYFGINVWGWRPIHHLMHKLCSDLIDKETPRDEF